MKFSEAVKALEEGKKVRQSSWTEGWYIFLNHKGYIIAEDGEVTNLNKECFNDSWQLYEEPEKLMPFEEALAFLKAGKRIKRKSWKSSHLYSNGNVIYKCVPQGCEIIYGIYFPDSEDLLATDWTECNND